MDGTSFVRLRWRLRGAWMWPCFIVLTIADGVIVAGLPPVGDRGSFVGGWLFGMLASLVGIAVLGAPLASLLRRLRPELPRTVARNYAGTLTTILVTAALLAGGIAHQHVITGDVVALHDATARAQAYIGDHAPARFQAHLARFDTYELQPPRLYRVCDVIAGGPAGPAAPLESGSVRGEDAYCVLVDRNRPFGQSVKYAGSEPNSLLARGTG